MAITGLERLPGAARAGVPDRVRFSGKHPSHGSDGNGAARSPQPLPQDVWDRTGPRHRRRATAHLVANWLLYCGLCIFAHWLHVAEPFDFRLQSYLDPMRVWGAQVQTLNDFVTFPINVTERPVHAVVLGLTFASLVTIPISIAILYRFPFSIPFVLVIALLAHLPWLAFTVLCSCVLASVRPFRLKFRYGAALVGLLPVVVYLFLATAGGDQVTSAYASPEERQMLAAPWILTVLGACTMLAAILGLARLTRCRPGVMTPIGAAMFATPLILFHRHVGADELSYRVLLNQWGPQSVSFEPARDARGRVVELLHRWSSGDLDDIDPDGETFLGLWSGREATRREVQRRIATRFAVELLYQRREAYEAAKRFIARYPTSRYVPCVLFLQARALDTRLSIDALLSEQPHRELYSDFPHVQSARVWERLLNQYPRSPLATIAALRLGQLKLRTGDVDGALAVLEQVRNTPVPASARSEIDPADSRRSPETTLLRDFTSYALDLDELIGFIRTNRDDPTYGNRPLTEFASLDPHRRGYSLALREVLARYQDSHAFADLAVRWAVQQENIRARVDALETLVCRFRQHPAFAAAGFYLGEIEILRLGRDDPQRLVHGLALLREVVNQHAHTAWAQRAAALLERVQPSPSVSRGDTPPGGGRS